MIYLHIGTEKTGTTSIQNSLAATRKTLSKAGLLYPESLGKTNHVNFYAAAAPARADDEITAQLHASAPDAHAAFRKATQAGLLREVAKTSPRKIVISNEHCSSRLTTIEEIETLRDFLAPLDRPVRVVIYLRRQDDFLVSSYSTDVKTGRTEPFALPEGEEMRRRYDYAALIDRWAAVFGTEAMVLRRFGGSFIPRGALMKDFMTAIGEAAVDVPELPVQNPSLGVDANAFLLQFNTLVPRNTEEMRFNPRRGNVADMLERLEDTPFDISTAERRAFMDRLQHSNETVRVRFFPEAEPGALFPPVEDDHVDTRVALDLDRAMRIAAELWTIKQQQVLDLRQKLLAKPAVKAAPPPPAAKQARQQQDQEPPLVATTYRFRSRPTDSSGGDALPDPMAARAAAVSSRPPRPAPSARTPGRLPVVVAMPVYNGSATVEAAIASIQAQTFEEFRILVYDDCSTDDSAEVVRRLAERDPRIELIRGPRNLGRGAARAALVEAAGPSLLCWQDDDDHWYPTKLQQQIDYALELELETDFILVSSYERVPPKGADLKKFRGGILTPPPLLSQEFLLSTRYRNYPFQLQASMGTQESYVRAGSFDPRLNWSEDYDLALRAVMTGCRIVGHAAAEPVFSYVHSVPSENIDKVLRGQRLIFDGLSPAIQPRYLLEQAFFRRRNVYAFESAIRQKSARGAATAVVEELSRGTLDFDVLTRKAEALVEALRPKPEKTAAAPVEEIGKRCRHLLRRVFPDLTPKGAQQLVSNLRVLSRLIDEDPGLTAAAEDGGGGMIAARQDVLAAALGDCLKPSVEPDVVDKLARAMLEFRALGTGG